MGELECQSMIRMRRLNRDRWGSMIFDILISYIPNRFTKCIMYRKLIGQM